MDSAGKRSTKSIVPRCPMPRIVLPLAFYSDRVTRCWNIARFIQRYDIICVCHAAPSTPVRIARPRSAPDLHITAPDGIAAYPYIVTRRTPAELHFIPFDDGFEIRRRRRRCAVYHIRHTNGSCMLCHQIIKHFGLDTVTTRRGPLRGGYCEHG